jgi:zinc protease
MKRTLVLLAAGMIIQSIIAVAGPKTEFSALKLPSIERKALLNGMQVLFFDAEGEDSPFLLMIENGAAFDPIEKWGSTYLMTRMILEGLVEQRYEQDFRQRGIEVESRVDWDALYFLGRAPASELEFALETLGELIVRPQLREDTFERLRAGLIEELASESRVPESRTQELFQALLFGDNPYGHSVKGTVETVENLEFRDIRIQQRRLLLPNQAKLAIFYSGDREALFRRFGRKWGSWVRSDAAPFTFIRASRPEKPLIRVIDTDSDRCLVRWGGLAVDRSSKDYFALKVLEQYITLSLPDWAQEISTSSHIRGGAVLATRKMPGYFQVNLEPPVADLHRYLERLLSTLQTLETGQIDMERFREAKSLVLQEFRSSFEEPFGRMMQILTTDLYQVGINFVTTYGLRLERVTPKQLQDALEEHFFSDGFALVVAAPAEKVVPQLEGIGEVEVLN